MPMPGSSGLEGLHFTDVTQQAGLDSVQSKNPLDAFNAFTGGVAACDFFGNGRIDFFVPRVGLPNELFRNNGNGTFTDVAKAAGVQGPDWKVGYAGAVCGDLNGDGRPDIYVTSVGNTGNVLFMNNGNGTFTNDTKAAGLTLPPTTTADPSLMVGSALGDYNHDGRLDLITLQWDWPNVRGVCKYGIAMCVEGHGGSVFGAGMGEEGGPCSEEQAREKRFGDSIPQIDPTRSRLYRNDGNGPGGIPHFTDVTKAMGLNFSDVMGFTPTFVDLTGNGWDDLVITGDGCTSQIYMNEDGKRFVDVTTSSGADTAQNGMGSVLADFSGDGLPDWFETAIDYPGSCPTAGTFTGCSGNRFYVNEGGGKFRDATDQYGVRDGGWGWGAVAGDFNNSGRLSIVQVDGMVWSGNVGTGPPTPLDEFFESFLKGSPRLWLNTGQLPFTEVAAQVGLTTQGAEKAVVAADYLNDGKLGLFITNTGGSPVLYRNDSNNDNGWVMIRLHDHTTENTFGVGARVRILATPTGPAQEQELIDGGSFESSDPLELHFGFGPGVSKVYEIEVFWPAQASPQVLHDVPIDRYLDITRS